MLSENRAVLFLDGRVLLCGDELPAVDAAKSLPLAESGDFGSLAPAGWLWGSLTPGTDLPEGWTALDRRDFGTQFGAELFKVMCTGWGLADWRHQSHFCGVCGAPMKPVPNDPHAMGCTKCGHLMYPIICPAMIVSVERDGKLLLAKNNMNKRNTISVLAGFLEVGESIEDAVCREVREEVNIEVDRSSIEYLYSQYWPFPRSLMLACRAQWKSGELHPDGVEIGLAGWYSPDELPDNIPGTVTVAGRLIRDFARRHGKNID